MPNTQQVAPGGNASHGVTGDRWLNGTRANRNGGEGPESGRALGGILIGASRPISVGRPAGNAQFLPFTGAPRRSLAGDEAGYEKGQTRLFWFRRSVYLQYDACRVFPTASVHGSPPQGNGTRYLLEIQKRKTPVSRKRRGLGA